MTDNANHHHPDQITDYMRYCIELAERAVQLDEVPVGAIIVDPESDEIIARAHNLVEARLDPTAHAEILAIKAACEALGQKRLTGYNLYVSLEPCPMCAAAISFARINHLYFGAWDEKSGGVEHGPNFYATPQCHHVPDVTGGILADECGGLLTNFFKAKRDK